MRNGYFITVEGCDGAGKSSIVSLIRDYLASRGIDAIASREPGGIAIAEQIRSVILDTANTAMDGRTEALLYAAARRQHYVEKIVPALKAGTTIVCDRFIDSSLAYQGFARGLGIDEVLAVNEFAIDKSFPDLTVYLDVEPEVGLSRIHAHDEREVNRLDLESLAFHRNVREGYLLLLDRFPDRIVKVDANGEQGDVFEATKQVLEKFLSEQEKA